jgi:glycosyltransferase involved in cell wall biosynthesis
VRLVLRAARLGVVHSAALAVRLAAAHGVEVRAVPMGVADPLAAAATVTPAAVRARHGVPADAVVVGAFGGLTPEKRLPELLQATASLPADLPVHVLLVGRAAAHYDVLADAAARGLADRVHLTGYVPDAELPAYLQAADIAACLRWPTNGETSASWLRAVAAGRPTIVTDLAHQPEVPVLDPRDWRPHAVEPIAAAVPLLDEANGLRAAIDRLARSAERRRRLGAAARAWWAAHHTLDHMADGYAAALGDAAARPHPMPAVPAHLRTTGEERLADLLAPFGVPAPPGVAR